MSMPEGIDLSFLSMHLWVGVSSVGVVYAVFAALKICILLLLLTCTPSLMMRLDAGVC